LKNNLLKLVKEKMEMELKNYLELLKIKNSSQIIYNSYEIVFKFAIISYIDSDYFCSYDDLLFLNSLDYPLKFLYDSWFATDCDCFNELKMFLTRLLDESSQEYKEGLKKVV